MGTEILEKLSGKDRVGDIFFKYALLAQIYGAAPVDESVLPMKKITDEIRGEINPFSYKSCTDDIILLYADGVIDEKAMLFLLRYKFDISDDLKAAKEYLLDKNDSPEHGRLSGENIGEILKCCGMAERSQDVTNVGFNKLMKIMGNPHTVMYDGGVKITDREFLKYLLDLGEPTGVINTKKTIIVAEEEGYQRNKQKGEMPDYKAPSCPCVLDYDRFAVLSWLYGKPYSADFWKYSREKNLSFENTESDYNAYIKRYKLHFDISSYTKKRDICQGVVNQFDYLDKAGENVMTADRTQQIDLEISKVDPECDDEQLIKAAYGKFTEKNPLDENTVVKIVHGTSDYWFIIRDREPVRIDGKQFNCALFDFNNIWNVAQELARTGQIKIIGSTLVLPQDICSRIERKDLRYAHEIIKEQYRLNEQHKKPNKLLSVLKADAQKEYRKLQATNAAKAENERKRNERNNTIGGNNSENTGTGNG